MTETSACGMTTEVTVREAAAEPSLLAELGSVVLDVAEAMFVKVPGAEAVTVTE